LNFSAKVERDIAASFASSSMVQRRPGCACKVAADREAIAAAVDHARGPAQGPAQEGHGVHRRRREVAVKAERQPARQQVAVARVLSQ